MHKNHLPLAVVSVSGSWAYSAVERVQSPEMWTHSPAWFPWDRCTGGSFMCHLHDVLDKVGRDEPCDVYAPLGNVMEYHCKLGECKLLCE